MRRRGTATTVPGVNEEQPCRAQTTPTAIDSGPAAADIDGNTHTAAINALAASRVTVGCETELHVDQI